MNQPPNRRQTEPEPLPDRASAPLAGDPDRTGLAALAPSQTAPDRANRRRRRRAPQSTEQDTEQVIAWVRRPDESAIHYNMFWLFVQLGVTRSYQKLADSHGYNLDFVRRLARSYDWGSRSNSYDDHLRAIEQSSAEYAAMQSGELLARRRAAIADTEEELSAKLAQAAHRVLDRFIADPGSVKHDLRSAATLADLASQLGRTAASSRNSLNGDGGASPAQQQIVIMTPSSYRSRLAAVAPNTDVTDSGQNVINGEIITAGSAVILASTSEEIEEYRDRD